MQPLHKACKSFRHFTNVRMYVTKFQHWFYNLRNWSLISCYKHATITMQILFISLKHLELFMLRIRPWRCVKAETTLISDVTCEGDRFTASFWLVSMESSPGWSNWPDTRLFNQIVKPPDKKVNLQFTYFSLWLDYNVHFPAFT